MELQEFNLHLRVLYEREEWFRLWLESLKESQPKPPSFTPSSDNTDEWKHQSGISVGYELLLNKIYPYKENIGDKDGNT